eukprot:CAMPEP_0196770316 /NCGR_PEP_ID=MMETSP1104-20130614/1071_1 /TAXON_ID=33652 /ORGANISM="Cafeteria sp., Strain Caron Lab Isolate" /LENGTH=330 /DNA_ID=CAMNT_0042140427 /DNA_START=97 /DNA_END=1089 /DNA_ORIENTATION=-
MVVAARFLVVALCASALSTLHASAAPAVLSFKDASSDKSALKLVEEALADPSTPISGLHVGVAMERGWWNTARRLVEVCRDRGIDVTGLVHQKASSIRRHLKEIAELLSKPTAMRSIHPAFQWAQSGDAIFLNVKFAHRIDAPATLDCVGDVSMTNTSLHLLAPCEKSGKRFELRLDFLRDIVPDNSTWSVASVGRMTFTLAKSESDDAWPRLLKSRRKPGNMHVWWSMRERYEGEMKNLTSPSSASSGGNASESDSSTRKEDKAQDGAAATGRTKEDVGRPEGQAAAKQQHQEQEEGSQEPALAPSSAPSSPPSPPPSPPPPLPPRDEL